MAISNWPNISVELEGKEGENRSLSFDSRDKEFKLWDNNNEVMDDGIVLSEDDIHNLADMFLTFSIHIKMHNGEVHKCELEVLHTDI